MSNHRRLLTIAAVVVALVAAATMPVLDAQVVAKRPIRILVGFSAGGTTDTAARLIARGLSESLARPVVVENKPGASGRIAAVALKDAAPDGATLMLAPMVVTTLAPMVWRHLDYDPAADFTPASHVANYAIALAVNPQVPARNLAEFVAWTKTASRNITYGITAAGGLPHLFGVTVGQGTGVAWVAVPYRGLPQLGTDLMGGQITAGFDALSNLIELHRDGKLRIIATSGARRSLLLPDVPTFKEQGLPAVEGTGWIALYAPGRVPKAAIGELSVAVSRILHDPKVRDELIHLGFEPTGTSGEELAAIMAADAARWRPIIESTRFAAD